jgi:small subunit ribosomal protein S16
VWRVVVADQRSPRDGRIIESIGHYNPQTEPSTIVIDRARLDHWIERGAQPTNTIRKLMRAPNTEPRVAEAADAVDVAEAADVAETDPAELTGVSAESGTDAEGAAAVADTGAEAPGTAADSVESVAPEPAADEAGGGDTAEPDQPEG